MNDKSVGPIAGSDCRTCGACCVGGVDDGHYADVTSKDVVQMSPHVRRRLVSLRAAGSTYLATPTRMATFGATCAFLRGTAAKRCSCSIYATRPKVCVDFRPGSVQCREARRELKLEKKI
jgi:Fe-S-cluster containining protein